MYLKKTTEDENVLKSMLRVAYRENAEVMFYTTPDQKHFPQKNKRRPAAYWPEKIFRA